MESGVRAVRLQVIDSRADLPTRATFGLMRRLTGVPVPDVIRMAGYRHRFFGYAVPRAGPGRDARPVGLVGG